MPREATILREGALDDAAGIERRPGEFARHAKTGAPYVTDPSKLTDAGLRKAELVELCAKHGIAFNPKATVPQLKALLGDLAKRGSKVQYGRPSSLGKQIENTTNLQKWSERAVALGLFMATDEGDQEIVRELLQLPMDRWNLDDDDARTILDAIAVKAKNLAQAGIAAERGTHGHELTEDHDNELDWVARAMRGEELGLEYSVQAALVAAWERALMLFGFEILAVESRCVDDVWRQAGTLDRIVRLTRDLRFVLPTGEIVVLPAGWVGILDIKTGKLRLDSGGFVSYWHGYAVQLASYAQSVPYDPDTDVRGSWPFEIDQRWAIIAHLDILSALDGEAKCRLVLVDLEAGRQAGALCVAAREWEKRTDVFSIPTDDLCVSVPVEPIAVPTTPVVEQPAEGEVAAAPSAPIAEHGDPNVAAADAQPAPESADSGVMTDEQIRAAYRALDDADKERVARMRDEHIAAELRQDRMVSRRDATALALRWIQPFDVVLPSQPAAPPALLPERVVRFTGDEGDTLPEAEALEARGWMESLMHADADGFAAVRLVAKQADDAGVGFHILVRSTRRRWEIYRGLACCARYSWSDELVRDLLAAVTGDDACRQPAIALGLMVGLLDLDQAIEFADLAARLNSGGVVPFVTPDDRVTFVPAGDLVGAAT